MLQITNRTPFKCSLGLFPNEEGVDCAYGAVKATFQIGEKGLQLAETQIPLAASDEFWGDPLSSSLKQAGEIGLARPSTEILLRGHAYSSDGKGTSTDVSLRVGILQKTVRVFGDRVWESGLFGLKISAPKPFEKIPLRYEVAFGGTDLEPQKEAEVDYEPRNPVGKGLVSGKSLKPAKGTPLPNLEDPGHLIKNAKDRPPPACFGPLCAHWEPRKSHAGTYDQAWLKKRAPYLPADFSSKFLQTAPRDLVAADYLKGGEPVEISGATPGRPLAFELPRCTFSFVFHFDGKPVPQPANLEVVNFEPDEMRVSLLWRSRQIIDKKVHRLRELDVSCREFGRLKVNG